jgi:hypothetical protein
MNGDPRFHPLADVWPLMNEAELADLAEDIRSNGQLMPILADKDGLIIDGRNRLLACERAAIEPGIELWDGDEENVASEIISLNAKRRHLSKGQLGAILAEMATVVLRGRPKKAGQDSDLESVNNSHFSEPPVTLKGLASAAGIDRAHVSHGRRLLTHAADLHAEVKARTKTMSTALGELDKRQEAAGEPKKAYRRDTGAPSGKTKVKGGKAVEPAAPAATPPPGLRLVHDEDDQLAEQVCHLIHRLREVAGKVEPGTLHRKFPGRLRHNLDQSLVEASDFLVGLRAAWRAESEEREAAGGTAAS